MKTALITGGSAGIGKETARALAQQGYEVIIAARDANKGQRIVSQIKVETPQAKIEFVSLDLTDFSAVRSFARNIRARWQVLDALILNAGLFTPELRTSQSGHEYMFATTHLGHFLLTHELLPLVRASTEGRIVVTSSVAHNLGTYLDFFNFEKPTRSKALMLMPFINYGRSKLCNLLFVRELAKQVANTSIKVNAFHPGSVKTEIWRDTPSLFVRAAAPFLISEREGAQTQIFLATEEHLKISGEYWVDKKVARSSRASRNPELARKLWVYSEKSLDIDRFGEPKSITAKKPLETETNA